MIYNQDIEEVPIMAKQKKYDLEYKIQAVKLARKTGQHKAARELGISPSTLHGVDCQVKLTHFFVEN